MMATVIGSCSVWYSCTAMFRKPTMFFKPAARDASIHPPLASNSKTSRALWGTPRGQLASNLEQTQRLDLAGHQHCQIDITARRRRPSGVTAEQIDRQQIGQPFSQVFE